METMKPFLNSLQKSPNALRVVIVALISGLLWVSLPFVFMSTAGFARIPMLVGYILTLALPAILMKFFQRELSVINVAVSTIVAMGLAGAVMKMRSLEFISARPLGVALFIVLFTAFFFSGLVAIAKLAQARAK